MPPVHNLKFFIKVYWNLRNTCLKYTKKKVPYKYKQVVKELSERRNIAILKADKGRGVVIMGRHKYTEKCL